MSKIDHIAAYRAELKVKYERKKRGEKLMSKYGDLLEMDRRKCAAARIVRWVRRHLFRSGSIIDCSGDEKMRGVYKMRLRMTELNFGPIGLQRESYKDCGGDKALIKAVCDSHVEICRVLIDLRVYGDYPEMEIIVPIFDFTLYLSEVQVDKVKSVWGKINPDSTNGIRFQQMLDSSKALAVLYGKKD
ncbi:MAG: hypothetical protein Hyperionvirus30_17 [Hyperionvirus sp.]|uniref:Uncharacterized protein n=1 Tax=Hyperionvirus sp. TaxID=2487770 RepID=A0A3G5AEA5_9VIRU|nr:MAG: hypothetical protein Hyperionvirus30_17 [Hyperionvirus sp.]